MPAPPPATGSKLVPLGSWSSCNTSWPSSLAETMLLTYMITLISWMFRRENHDGDKANITETWRMCLPCPEEKKLEQLHKDIPCWPHAILWLAKTYWGYLAILVGLFLYLVVNEWTKLYMANLQERRRHRETVTPLETDTEQEVNLEYPERTRSLHDCATQTTDFESYKQPPETYGPSYKSPHNLGIRCPHEMDLYVNSIPRRKPYWKSSSSSPYSSSISSSSCSASPPHLNYTPESQAPTSTSPQTVSYRPPAIEAVPTGGPLATEAAQSGGQDSSHDVDDSSKTQDNSKGKSRSIPVLVKQTETPEENEPQPQPSIAQIYNLQSYHEDDNVIFERKALAIFMGQAQTLPDTKTEEEMEDEEPTELFTMGQKSQHVDKNIRHKYAQDPCVQGFILTVDTAILKAPSESRLCTESDSSSSSTTLETEPEPLPPTQEDISEEARQLLEYHIKKKMIQGRCGMPTIIAASLKLFHAMASSCPKEPVACSKQPPKPKQALVLTDTRPVSPCPKSVAIAMNQIRYIPQRQGYSIFLSIEPEEIKRLAFHTGVKMLEIKMGAFPNMVVKSLLIFEILSRQPLPKMLRFGNKIQRSVHSSLHFLTSEALCILELNVTHKCLIITRKLSTLDMKEARRMTFEKPRDLEGDPRFSEEPFGATVIPEMCPEGAKPGPAAGPETQNQFGTFSFPGLTMTVLHSSKPTGSKVNTAKWASNKPWNLNFHEAPILKSGDKENVFDFGGLATIPELRGFTHPFPSPMVTAMTSRSSPMTMMIPSSSRPGGPEDVTTERGSKTSTPPCSGPGRPEADARKKMSRRPCTPQDAHLLKATYPESRTTEKASCPKLGEQPDSQMPPNYLTTQVSETYLKYMVSPRSARTVREEPLLTLLPKKPLDTGAKEGSGPCGKGIKTEVGGKGTDAEKGMDSEVTYSIPGIGREEVVPNSCQEEEDGPIKRTSIFLELELKKENLNLHLKKRLNANLQPPQHAAMEVNIEVDKVSTGKKEKVRRPLNAEARRRQRRPFLYVCMPADDTGSAVKTVCWTLPKWILEMNGNRVPQVARFEKRSKVPKPAV